MEVIIIINLEYEARSLHVHAFVDMIALVEFEKNDIVRRCKRYFIIREKSKYLEGTRRCEIMWRRVRCGGG